MKEKPKENTAIYYSSCSMGLVGLLEKEIKENHLNIISSGRGGAYFSGRKEDVKDFCLKSRVSSRISVPLVEFKGSSYDHLYRDSMQFPWEDVIPVGKTFKLEVSGTHDRLRHNEFTMYRIKDSIKDRFRKLDKQDPTIERENPDICFLIRLNFDHLAIHIALSPRPLNQRGYRLDTGDTPIRENMAQALLYFSDWNKDSPIIDPFCGSGTILIEAALFCRWNGFLHYPVLKNSYTFSQMFGKVKMDPVQSPKTMFFGCDIDKRVIEKAKQNAFRADVLDWIQFKSGDFREMEPVSSAKGFVISNPPYAERVGEKEDAIRVYEDLGRLLKDKFSGYSFTLITGDTSLLGHLSLKQEDELKVSIAKLKGKIVKYKLYE